MQEKYELLFQQFTVTFHPKTIQYWEQMITAWKNDHTQPNPYLEPLSCKQVYFLQLIIILIYLYSNYFARYSVRTC